MLLPIWSALSFNIVRWTVLPHVFGLRYHERAEKRSVISLQGVLRQTTKMVVSGRRRLNVNPNEYNGSCFVLSWGNGDEDSAADRPRCWVSACVARQALL